MNRILLFLILCLVGTGSLEAQYNPSAIDRVITTEESAVFELRSDVGKPTVASAQMEGVVSVSYTSGNRYEVTYTPKVGYTGKETFALKSMTFASNPFFPTAESTLVTVEVVRSKVKANDDFVYVSGTDSIELFPLANDVSASGMHTVRSIAQVMYGTAELTDDNSILYTPNADAVLDYIVYTIADDKGTTSTATLYIKQQEGEKVERSYAYTISSTQTQYVLLDGTGYTTTQTPTKGIITLLEDQVALYTPHPQASGADTVVLQSNKGNTVKLYMDILSSYQDEGLVRDDRFYTAIGEEIVFDVLQNDLDRSLTIDLANTSIELTHLGGGTFSYTPDASFSGVKTFFYRARNGSISEKGAIDIVVSDFTPKANDIYAFTIPTGSTLSLPYDVPLAGTNFTIISMPQYGTLSYYDGNGIVTAACGDTVAARSILYTPYAGYQGMDEYEVAYCPTTLTNRCTYLKTKITVTAPFEDCACVSDCVWQGDANNDGQVDMLDVVSIARQLGQSGASRSDETDWVGQQNIEWDAPAKYADADGDGTVTTADLAYVRSNYGKIHSYARQNVLAVKAYPFYLVPRSTKVKKGEKMVIDIYAGTADAALIDVQGLTFAVNLTPSYVDSSSVQITYPTDGFFVYEAPHVTETHQPKDGRVVTAVSKSYDRHTSNGHGLLAQLEFVVEEEIEGIRPHRRSVAHDGYIADRVIIDNIVLQDKKGDVYALPSVSIDYRIEVGATTSARTVAYPNPASQTLYVSTLDGDQQVQLTDLLGRTVRSQGVAQTGQVQLDVRGLEFGTYVLSVVSADGVHTEKIVVVE